MFMLSAVELYNQTFQHDIFYCSHTKGPQVSNQEIQVRFLVGANLQDWFKKNLLAGETGVR